MVTYREGACFSGQPFSYPKKGGAQRSPILGFPPFMPKPFGVEQPNLTW